MKDSYYRGFRLGILGGGQLGRMLIQPAVDLNIQTCVLDPDPNAPCRAIAGEFRQGDFRDYDTVLEFGRTVDVLTIEIEHVNVDALARLEAEGKTVYPSSSVIRLVQDKGLQKSFYREHSFPTSDFVLVDDHRQLRDHLEMLPAFQKSRTAGYDGRGVKGIFTPEDLEEALEGPSLLEKKVDYHKEIAVVVARSATGEVRSFPVVEMVFHPQKNLLEYLAAPADLPEAVTEKAVKLAEDIARKLDMVGLLAVEMFATADGEILVNEMAPRPHNSGHHTIEANVTSQYAQHLRAILGLPLGDTRAHGPAVMINLLGEPGYEGEALYKGLDEVLRLPGVHVHLYGKAFTKPYRKMGHVTVTGQDWDTVRGHGQNVIETLKIIA